MAIYTFSQTNNIIEAFKGLNKTTKDLSIKVYNLLIVNQLEKMKFSKIEILPEAKLCSFILYSDTNENAEFKIDIYEKYYDLFVNTEEVAIQQEILTSDESLKFIVDYLKSNIEEITIESKSKIILKKQINFYIKGKKKNSIGSISVFPYLIKKKYKKIVEYGAWINE